MNSYYLSRVPYDRHPNKAATGALGGVIPLVGGDLSSTRLYTFTVKAFSPGLVNQTILWCTLRQALCS